MNPNNLKINKNREINMRTDTPCKDRGDLGRKHGTNKATVVLAMSVISFS